MGRRKEAHAGLQGSSCVHSHLLSCNPVSHSPGSPRTSLRAPVSHHSRGLGWSTPGLEHLPTQEQAADPGLRQCPPQHKCQVPQHPLEKQRGGSQLTEGHQLIQSPRRGPGPGHLFPLQPGQGILEQEVAVDQGCPLEGGKAEFLGALVPGFHSSPVCFHSKHSRGG